MTERRLQRQLAKVARRMRHRNLLGVWSVVWLAAAAIGVGLIASNGLLQWDGRRCALMLGGCSVIAAMCCVWSTWHLARNSRLLARRIETTFPDLGARLLTAVELEPALPGGRFGFLQDRVIQQSLDHAYGHRWEAAVPVWHLLIAHALNMAGLAALSVVVWWLFTLPRPTFLVASSIPLPAVPDNELLETRIEPGDTEVERGGSVLVLARFHGGLPTQVELTYQPTDAQSRDLAMTKSLDDPVFGARITDIQRPGTYFVTFAEQRSPAYRIAVFDYPALVRADARLVFPDYTSLEDRLLEDVRQIAAVEGTRITLDCRLNKSVRRAQLVDGDGPRLDLTRLAQEENCYRVEFVLDKSRRLELQLEDDAGRTNREHTTIVLQALPNKPPDLKLVQPARDIQVSPLEELDLAANAFDDFGLRRVGLSYLAADGRPAEVVLATALPGGKRVEVQHQLAFESLQAQPDDLVSYHFWAEDTAPDGAVRRASSDLFFAEVRPFEEIFRQGESPANGESPPSAGEGDSERGQGEQLAELQKQIVNGIWKVIRRETGATPSPEFADDVGLLSDSQTQALDRAGEMQQQLTDPSAGSHLQNAQKFMSAAATELNRAKDVPAPDALQAALPSAQDAYRELLKLRAREHEVVRGNPRSRSSGQASSRSQQQLQQLELKNDRNRYETERQARADEQGQQQETRQVLNRLRELARRQGDVNERLKELQSALQEAQDEQQREELARQLKRLREQQQELLQDTDELLAQMQQPENAERMAANRQQMEQAREQARQAAESLQQGQVSRAVASGTRAQRELERARDDLRQTAASQFSEEMREMSTAATELDERQQALSEQLRDVAQPREDRRSLRDPEDRQDLPAELAAQEERLKRLLDDMRQTVLEAEQTEPLLAEKLYDTYRQTEQRQPERSLAASRQSLEQGLVEDAAREEQAAGQGIRELREGVERAAESVLGDETESLRRARDLVEDLVRQIQEETEQQARDQAATANAPTTGDPAPTSDEAKSAPPRPGSAAKGNAPARNSTSTPMSPAGQSQADGNDRASSSPEGLGGFEKLRRDTESNTLRLRAPLTGGDFRAWSDQLRDVEEIVSDPELRAQAGRVRDRAREFRQELQRHSQSPNWDLVQLEITQPLSELRDRLQQEILQRTDKDALVPIDRDPVPPQFQEQVRRYYEQLGSGR
jgi:hypothetical protein